MNSKSQKVPGRYQWGRGGEGNVDLCGDRVSVQEGGKLRRRMVVKVAGNRNVPIATKLYS